MEWFSLTVRIDSRKAGPSRHLCHKLFRLMREHLRGRDLDSTVDLILEELFGPLPTPAFEPLPGFDLSRSAARRVLMKSRLLSAPA